MRPEPRQAIGLKLHPHLERIGLMLARACAQLLHLAQDAQFILDVMGDFMGDHICRGEVSFGAKPVCEKAEKGGIEIRAPIGRAVEWPGRA